MSALRFMSLPTIYDTPLPDTRGCYRGGDRPTVWSLCGFGELLCRNGRYGFVKALNVAEGIKPGVMFVRLSVIEVVEHFELDPRDDNGKPAMTDLPMRMESGLVLFLNDEPSWSNLAVIDSFEPSDLICQLRL